MSMSSSRLRLALAAALGCAAVCSAPALAQQASASGEVRSVDAAAGKITIRHGAIAQLSLPAMTLVYRADPALLADIRPGDKVVFTAARKDGAYVVLAIKKS